MSEDDLQQPKAKKLTMKELQDRVAELEDQLLLTRKEQAGAQRHYEICHTIVQEHALPLWFKCEGQRIPLQQDGVLYQIMGGNMKIKKAVPIEDVPTLNINDEEVAYLQRYAYEHLLERHATPTSSEQHPPLPSLPSDPEG